MMKRSIDIKGVLSNDPDVFFFTLSVPLVQDASLECTSVSMAQGSNLFRNIFQLDWVEKAAVEGRALIVRKKTAAPSWDLCAPEIAKIIRNLYEAEVDFFSKEYILQHKKTAPPVVRQNHSYTVNKANTETPLGRAITEVLVHKVSPGLASHGGYVEMIDLKDGEVHLYFGGGCQGCSQASNTVKYGIEKVLLQEFPELKKVVDVTDHSQGKNPFFK